MEERSDESKIYKTWLTLDEVMRKLIPEVR